MAEYLRKICSELNENDDVKDDDDDDDDDDDINSKDVEVVEIGIVETLTMLDRLANKRRKTSFLIFVCLTRVLSET